MALHIAAENIGDVKIIWETADGLVTIAEENGKAKLDMESGTIKYKVNLACKNSDIEASNTLNSQNYKGGNALIGAFGKNQDGSVNYNDLLWSWHIWVCPDIDTDRISSHRSEMGYWLYIYGSQYGSIE